MEAGENPAQGRCCDSRMAGADATGMTGKALRPAADGLPRDQSEYLPVLFAALAVCIQLCGPPERRMGK